MNSNLNFLLGVASSLFERDVCMHNMSQECCPTVRFFTRLNRDLSSHARRHVQTESHPSLRVLFEFNSFFFQGWLIDGFVCS